MTNDQPQPDAPRRSPEEARDRLVAEAVAHSAALEAQYREPMAPEGPPSVWKVLVALLIAATAAYVAARPPALLTPGTPPVLRAGELERGARAALYLQAQQIEAFRLREGRLPRSLDEVGARVPDVAFVRSNNRVYQLVTSRPDGSNLVYDSARPSPAFAAVTSGWPGWSSEEPDS